MTRRSADRDALSERELEAEIRRVMPTIFEGCYFYLAVLEAANRLGIGQEILLRVRRDPVLAADVALLIAGRAAITRQDESNPDTSDGICRLTVGEFARLLGYFIEPVERLPIDAFAINILKNAGFTTIGHVVQHSPDDLVSLPGRGRRNKRIGDATLLHLRNEWLRHGLRWEVCFSEDQQQQFGEALALKATGSN